MILEAIKLLTTNFGLLKTSVLTFGKANKAAVIDMMTLDGVSKTTATSIMSLGTALKFAFAGLIIYGVIKTFDALTTSVAEAQESLQEFKKATEELENVENELSSINDKIDEIQSKGPLSITDQAELSKLEKEKELLGQQVKLLELKAKLAGEKSNYDAIKTVDGGAVTYGEIERFGIFKHYHSKNIETRQNSIERIRAKIENNGASNTEENYKLQQQIVKHEASINESKIKLSEKLVKYQELLGQITGDDSASKATREKLQAEIDSLESQLYSKEELTKKDFDKYVSNNKDLETTFRSLTNNGTEVTADSLKTLLKLFPELEKYVENTDDGAVQLAKDLGILSEKTDETSQGAKTLSSALGEAETAYELLNAAQKEFNDDGRLSSDTIQETLNKYSSRRF